MYIYIYIHIYIYIYIYTYIYMYRERERMHTATIPFLYAAIEPDSLIAFWGHFLSFLSFDCL